MRAANARLWRTRCENNARLRIEQFSAADIARQPVCDLALPIENVRPALEVVLRESLHIATTGVTEESVCVVSPARFFPHLPQRIAGRTRE